MLFRIALTFLLSAILFAFEVKPNPYIDSLKEIASSKAHDTIIYNALNKIAIAYSDSAYQKSIDYWKEALLVSQRSKNRSQMAYLYGRIGQMLFEKGEFTEALDSYRNALAIYDYIEDKKGKAISYNDIGLVYKTWGRYENALENYLLAMKLFNEIKLDEGLAIASNNIGQIYYYRDDYKKSIEYFSAYLNLNQHNNNARAVAGASNNIAAAYMALKDFDLALEYYKKALHIYDSLQIKLGVAILEDNIGSLFAQKENYSAALDQHFKALRLLNEIKSEARKSYVLKNIGFSYFKMNKYTDAIGFFNKSIEIARDHKQLETLKEVYQNLSEVYQSTNNPHQALRFYKKYIEIKDSLLSIETHENLTMLELQYESEKKTQELALVYNKLEQQKTLWVVIGFLLFGFVVISSTVIWLGKRSVRELKRIKSQNRNLKQILDKLIPEENYLQQEPDQIHVLSSGTPINNRFVYVKKNTQGTTLIVNAFFNQPTDGINIIKSNLQMCIDDFLTLNNKIEIKQLLNDINNKVNEINDIYDLLIQLSSINLLLINKTENLLQYSGDGNSWLFDGNKIVRQEKDNNFIITESINNNCTFYNLIDIEGCKIVNVDKLINIEKTLQIVAGTSFSNQKEVLQSTLDSMELMSAEKAILFIHSCF